MAYLSTLPKHAILADLTTSRPAYYEPLIAFSEQVMRGPSPLSQGERELIAAFVSALNGCDYCTGAHRAAAEAFGVDASLLEAVVDDIDSAPVEDRLRPVLRFVRKLTETPARMTETEARAVLAAGWTEDALHDVVAVCGLFNLFNRLVDGHGIEADPARYQERATLFKERGYLAPFHARTHGSS